MPSNTNNKYFKLVTHTKVIPVTAVNLLPKEEIDFDQLGTKLDMPWNQIQGFRDGEEGPWKPPDQSCVLLMRYVSPGLLNS